MIARSICVFLFGCMVLSFAWDKKQVDLGGLEGFVERMGAGVREEGMGHVGVADLTAQPGAYWNPALVAAHRQGLDIYAGGERRALSRAGAEFGIQAGVGTRMGVGAALLGHGDMDFLVISEDDEDLGTAMPYFYMAYLAIGWRLNRIDLLGLSFSKSGENLGISDYYDVRDNSQSPTSYNLGWHRTWNSRFQSGVVIRNLGVNRDLSARWTRNPTNESESKVLRPKTLEVGASYQTRVLGRAFNMQMEVLDYLLADTLMVFDPDWHYWTARMGTEWEAIPCGWIRAGFNSGNITCGLGYQFDLRWDKKPWPLQIDWALEYEREAGLWNPLTVGVRTRIP
ncbi:MAG TPA: hypothetical protein VLM37_11230 [Fibrobacteraceae bacterium]|nr:hypothetical protein [Fibrobacteraceae bacterium]